MNFLFEKKNHEKHYMEYLDMKNVIIIDKA